jgi:hypothetical protein
VTFSLQIVQIRNQGFYCSVSSGPISSRMGVLSAFQKNQ